MATAGKTAIGASEDFDAANDGDIDGPYSVSAGATITEFHVYIRSSSAAGSDPAFRPLIYADSGGEPGALIATLPEIALLASDTTGAWRDLTGLSVSVGAATAIWIGLWFKGSNHRYSYDSPGGTPGRYKGTLATYSQTGDAPSTWPTASDSTSSQEHSQYVVYTAGGGTDATVTGVIAASTASSVAPPKPRPSAPFSEINVRM